MKLRDIYINARDKNTPNKDIYDRKNSELTDTIQKLDDQSKKEGEYRNLPLRSPTSMKDFDTIASENLSYLIEYKFDKI
jgi:hypothetical protein